MKQKLFACLILFSLLISACASPARTPTRTPRPTRPTATEQPATNTRKPNPTRKKPTQTKVMTATQVVTDLPSNTPTETPPVETPTSGPTLTPSVTPTASTTMTATPCIMVARFVDESPQDGQEFRAGETFKKSWTFQNAGTCTWDASTLVLQDAASDGDTRMSGGQTNAFKFSANAAGQKPFVAPGDDIVVTLSMQAPKQPGEYVQHWRIVDTVKNQQVGILSGDQNRVSVKIIVPDLSGQADIRAEYKSLTIQQGGMPCSPQAIYLVTLKLTGALPGQRGQYALDLQGNGTVQENAGGDITFGSDGAIVLPRAVIGPGYTNTQELVLYVRVTVGDRTYTPRLSICANGVWAGNTTDQLEVSLTKVEHLAGGGRCKDNSTYLIDATMVGPANKTVQYTWSGGGNGLVVDGGSGTLTLSPNGVVNFPQVALGDPYDDRKNVSIYLLLTMDGKIYSFNQAICSDGQWLGD